MEADWSVEIGADLPSITVPWSAQGLAFIDLRHPARQALSESSRSSSAQSTMPGIPPAFSEFSPSSSDQSSMPGSPSALSESSPSSSAQSSLPRLTESLAAQLPEAQHYPALGRALARLNSAHSQVYTSKCDVWTLEAADLDPLEMESTAANCISGFACYIDLVRSGKAAFEPFAEQEVWLKCTTQALRATPSTHSRADLVLRSAHIATTSGEPRDGFAITLYITGCGSNPAAAHSNWQQALAQAATAIATLSEATH